MQHLCNQQRRWWHAVIVVLLAAEAEVACSVHALVTALWYAAEAEVACSIFVASMVTALWCVGWRRYCIGWERLRSASLVSTAS